MALARRIVAALAVGALALSTVAAFQAADDVFLEPAEDGTTAVRKGQFIDVSGTVDAGSSFIRRAQVIGYDRNGDEFVRQDVFGANTPADQSGGQSYLDVDSEGNVDGRVGLNCQFGDATSMPQDRVHDACEVGDTDAQGITEDQTTTAWDLQLVIEMGSGEVVHSDVLRVDPIPPVIEGYEVTSPTTIEVTFSEPVTHPTGVESPSDWLLRAEDGTPRTDVTVVGVAVGDDDCAYAPGEDPRSGQDGCTRTLTISPALPRDATPRVDYFPRARGAHEDGAANTVFVRSIEPSRGADADSLAADRVGPLPPAIEQVADQPATDPSSGERLVLGNEPAPMVVVGDVQDGMPVVVYVDGVAAGSATASGTTASVTLEDALPDGVYDLTATSADAALCDPEDPDAGTCSNESEPSPAVTYDLDTVAPQLVGNPLARPSTISMEFDEGLIGDDSPSDWTVDNGLGDPVTITSVDDERDDAAVGEAEPSPRRTLSYTGGPIVPGATLTYAPGSGRYADEHANGVLDFTADLEPALLPVVSVQTQPGAEVDRAGVGAPADPVSFTIELSDPVAIGETVTIDYATVPGTATTGADYEAVTGTVTFSAGEQASDPINVSVAGDRIDEPSEFVGLELSNPTGARFPDDASTLTAFENIEDDDPAPTVGFTAARYDAPEGGSATVTVELTDAGGDQLASGKEVRVAWSTRFERSADTSDAPEQSGEVVFAPGSTTGSFEVETLPDDTDEPDELFEVVLTDPVNAMVSASAGSAEIDILDDDVLAPVISIDGRSADENDPGDIPLLDPGTVELEVHLSQATSRSVRVDWATGSAGSATAEEDFRAASGQLEFEPGDTVLLVEVPLVDDELDEFDETIEVVLTNPDGATLAGDVASLSGFGTIIDDDAPAVAAFAEGSTSAGVDEGAMVDLTVELDTASGKDVVVDWETRYDGSATDADAPAQSGAVVVPAGQTTATFAVATSQDDETEGDEDFQVVLTGATDGDLAAEGLVATVTILDDEVALPTLTVTGGSVAEDALAVPPLLEAQLTYDFRLSEAAASDVTVGVRTLATGTATPGEDFTGTSGTVTIEAGETAGSFSVVIEDDELDEFDETVPLLVEGVAGARLPGGVDQVVVDGTITDDDPLVTVDLGEDVEVTEGEPATFDITLSEVSGKDVQVRIVTSDGSAGAGSDYRATDRTLTIPAGDTSTTVTIPTLDDSRLESTEDVDVSMSVVADDMAELGRSAAVLRIADDDLGTDPGDTVVSLTGDAVDEGDPLGPLALPVGGNQLAFVIDLSRPADGPVTIEYVTRAGTATPDDDFIPVSGSVTIPDGEDTVTVTVDVVADRTDEFDEDLQLVLTDVSGDAVLPGGELVRTGRILDDDAAAQLRVSDATVLEGGAAELDITLDNASGKPITVEWELVDGTATAGADYADDSGTLSFPAGTTSRTVTVATLADSDATELIEQFELVLSTATNAGIDDARGTVSIVDVDADGLPTVTAVFLEDVRTTEADSDRTALVPVRLSAASDQDVTVTWTSQRLTAADGEDYVADGGQVVIPAGATSTQIPVTILGDDEVEPDEDFLLLLTEAEGAVITGPTGRVTIEDDDAADDGATGGGDDDADDGAPDPDEDGELAATGGGAGFVVLGLGLLAARRRREDD